MDSAVVERDACKLREEQLEEDVSRTQQAMERLVEEVGGKIKREVDKAKCEKDEKINKLMKEIEVCFYFVLLLNYNFLKVLLEKQMKKKVEDLC